MGSRRMSSAVLASLTSQLNLADADVLGRCMPVRDYLSVAIRAFNSGDGQHGVYWPSSTDRPDSQPVLSKRGSVSMVFSTLSKDPVLTKLSDINFKSGIILVV